MKWLLLLVLVSCSKKEVTHIYQNALTMPLHVQIGKSLTAKERARAETIIRETFAHIDETVNHWNPRSEISRLNRHPIDTPFPLSTTLRALLLEAKAIAELSDYHFDPGQGAASSALKEKLYGGDLPPATPGTIANLNIEKSSCTKTAPLTLDCDGIAKGFAIDALLEKLPFDSVYINWGGEIATKGKHPADRPWQVATLGEIIPLETAAIATSNNFYQSAIHENQTISHYIGIDGKPLPIKKNLTVSIATKRCSVADALATALMTLESKQAREAFLEKVQKQWEVCYYGENEEEPSRL